MNQTNLPTRTQPARIEVASEMLSDECGEFQCDVLYCSNDPAFLRQRFEGLSSDAKRLISLGSAELFRLTHPQELYVPGEWRCDRCEFRLHKRLLSRQDGSVGTDRNPALEICPNHCVMHPDKSTVRAGIEDIPLCLECAERFTTEVETALNPHDSPFYKTIVEGRDATIMRPLTWKEADKENTQSILYAQELLHQAINRIDALESAWPPEYSMPAELLDNWRDQALPPVPMVLHCPACWTQHIDEPETQAEYEARLLARQSDPNPETYDGVLERWTNPPHKSHRCSNCKVIFRPALIHTVGVKSIQRGKNDTWPPVVSDHDAASVVSDPHWEVVSDTNEVMHHVRWSEPDAQGFYLSVRHYPQKHFAESDARRFNEEGRGPWEFPAWRPREQE